MMYEREMGWGKEKIKTAAASAPLARQAKIGCIRGGPLKSNKEKSPQFLSKEHRWYYCRE